jgi:enoyl-CoA hydratase/carnithine racemase
MLRLVTLIVLVLVAAPAAAADDTTGKVTIEIASFAAGVGFARGNGVLEYRGQSYPFTVTGFSIGEVGAAKIVARGEVTNLRRIEDFDGMYVAAVAGAAVGGGAGAVATHNQNSVNMVWMATHQGVSFSLASAGLSVRLAEAPRR